VVQDAPALAALDAACSPHPWSERQFAAALESDRERVLVARSARSAAPGLVGFCVEMSVADEVHIHSVAVHPEWRRRGLGRLLLETALGVAERSGATRAFLEVRAGNAAALALYGALGFAATGRRRDYYESPREDAVVMALALTAVDRPGGEACGER
jgi:ribosomal-protein-alanine N-acetyltransferase